jgi:hypothetical protein
MWCIVLFFIQHLLILGIVSGILFAIISAKNFVMVSAKDLDNRVADCTRDKD